MSRESGSRVFKEGPNARRYVRRDGITGNSTSGGLWATPPLPVQDSFVYQVNSDDTTAVLSGYLRSHGILPIAVASKNQQGSKFNSFKVTVNIDNVEKIMERCGICVRRWREHVCLKKVLMHDDMYDVTELQGTLLLVGFGQPPSQYEISLCTK